MAEIRIARGAISGEGVLPLRRSGLRAILPVLVFALLCAPTVIGLARSVATADTDVLELGWRGVIRQDEPNTCGPAVLATLLAMLGVERSETEIASRAALGPRGVTLAEFGRLSHELGLPGQWLRLTDTGRLEALPKPSVVHIRDSYGHFAILLGVAGGFVQLADPARGNVLVRKSVFERRWTGRVFVFEPSLEGS
jgi:predicted double-glycine peptidase